MENRKLDHRPVPDEPPPFGRTWARVYTGVIVYLTCMILALSLITRYLTS